MPKVKKLKRSKRFRVNVNRKRLRNKMRKLPNIECQQIKEAWEVKRSTFKNLEEMGLAYDPNVVLKIPNVKQEMLKSMKNDSDEENSEVENDQVNVPKKIHVAKSLEEEAKHPRAKLFRLPNNEVRFITYMMDKYGDDYKGMVRDRKNYNQLTWRQIRAKIERFKNIPEQYAEYLVQKGEIVLEDPTPLKKIKPDILRKPIEKKSDSKSVKRKIRKKNSKLLESIWKEESILEDEREINKTVGDDDIQVEEVPGVPISGEQKLKLFSDDEDDESEDFDNNDDEDDDDDSNDSEIETKKHKSKLIVKKYKVT